MKIYSNLYVDEILTSEKEEILKKIKRNELQIEIYLIILAKNQKNHLEVYNSMFLTQQSISKQEMLLVGIAGGYLNAMNLVEKITQDVYDETKNTDIRNYVLKKQLEYEERNV